MYFMKLSKVLKYYLIAIIIYNYFRALEIINLLNILYFINYYIINSIYYITLIYSCFN